MHFCFVTVTNYFPEWKMYNICIWILHSLHLNHYFTCVVNCCELKDTFHVRFLNFHFHLFPPPSIMLKGCNGGGLSFMLCFMRVGWDFCMCHYDHQWLQTYSIYLSVCLCPFNSVKWTKDKNWRFRDISKSIQMWIC